MSLENNFYTVKFFKFFLIANLKHVVKMTTILKPIVYRTTVILRVQLFSILFTPTFHPVVLPLFKHDVWLSRTIPKKAIEQNIFYSF